MSNHRIDPRAGWRKPDGKCRWCDGPVPTQRNTFCGPQCVHEHKIRTDPGYVRDEVWKRDRGICAACGLDTDAFRDEMVKARRNGHPDGSERVRLYRWARETLAARGFSPEALYPGDFWQADHIVEVVRGGGGCGLENYQTLCTVCHKAKTKRLAAERKAERKAAKEEASQSLLRRPQ